MAQTVRHTTLTSELAPDEMISAQEWDEVHEVTGTVETAGIADGAVTDDKVAGGISKSKVGLGNVDNTSDANKPISTATQTALDGKAASSHTHALSQLEQGGATTGQVVKWTGTAWAPGTDNTGGGGGGATQLAELSDVDDPVTPTAGNFLRGDGDSWASAAIQAGDVPSGIDAAKIGDGSVSSAEFQRLDGVTSAIQTQIDGKAEVSHDHNNLYYTEAETDTLLDGKEDTLGNPSSDGQMLVSTTAGVRSWQDAPGGGSGSARLGVIRDLIHSQQTSGPLKSVPHTPQVIRTAGGSGTRRYFAYPSIVADRQARIQVFQQRATENVSTDGTIERLVSVNGGATWTVEELIAIEGEDLRTAKARRLADGRLGLVYWSHILSPETWVTRWRTSSDDGESWSSDTQLAAGLGDWQCSESWIEKDGVIVVALYVKDAGSSPERWSAYVIRSTDGGTTWGAPIKVADGSADDSQYNEAQIVVWDGKLVMFIRDEVSFTLYRSESADNGISWSALVDVTPTNWVSTFPGVHILGQVMMIVYRSTGTYSASGTSRAYSYDGGVTWGNYSHGLTGWDMYSWSVEHDGLLIVVRSYESASGGLDSDTEITTWRLGPAVGLDGTFHLDSVSLGGDTITAWPSGGTSYDADAQAFFTAAGITDDTQKSAYNDFVTTGKSDGWYDDLVAFWPYVGGASGPHSYDSVGLTTGTFSGTVTHNANGVAGDGSSGYMSTGITLSSLSNTSHALIVHVRSTAQDGGIAYGGAGATGTGSTGLYPRWTDDTVYTTDGGAALNGGSGQPSTDASGTWIVSRTASDSWKVFRNGSQVGSTETGSATLPAVVLYALANNSNGTANNFFGGNVSAFGIAAGLSDTKVGQITTAIQELQTALSR